MEVGLAYRVGERFLITRAGRSSGMADLQRLYRKAGVVGRFLGASPGNLLESPDEILRSSFGGRISITTHGIFLHFRSHCRTQGEIITR